MEQMKLARIKAVIQNADQCLIGIGEAYNGLPRDLENTGIGRIYLNNQMIRCAAGENLTAMGGGTELSDAERDFLKVLAFREADKRKEKILEAYEILYGLVKDKPHFVVTMNTDDLIYQSSFAKEQIVAPCGSIHMLQCSRHILEPCETEPLFDEMEKGIREGNIFADRSEEGKRLTFPRCPVCNGLLKPNTIETEGYLEDAYLPSWKVYTSWLTRTLNRRLCVLELGVSFAHPSVIRFPFEKTVFYNKQASLIRVNERFYQIPEEMKEKGLAVQANAIDFVLGLKEE